MNHKRKIAEENFAELNRLFKYGIPIAVLEKVFDASYATIRKAIVADIKEESLDFKELPAEKKLFLFKLYAWIVTDETDCALSVGTTRTTKLAKGIYEYLKLKEWEDTLAGMKTLTNSYRKNRFEESVSEQYRNLINEVFPTNEIKQNAPTLFKELLTLFHKEKLPFPEADDIAKPYLVLGNLPLEIFKQEGFVRYFDQSVVLYLQSLMNNLETKRKLYIKSYFGLSTTPFPVLFEKLRHAEGTAQILNRRAIQNLQSWISKIEENSLSFAVKQKQANISEKNDLGKIQKEFAAFKKKSEKERSILKENLFCLATQYDKTSALSERASSIIAVYGKHTTPQEEKEKEELELILDKRIDDLDLSVRTYKCLRYEKKIETIRELVQLEAEDLLRIRNFGKNSLAEVRSLFEHDFGGLVHFGMILK